MLCLGDSVVVFTSSVLDVIPRILARSHAERPDVQIGLHTMTKVQQIEALRERRITVGFNRLMPEVAGITTETVVREKVVVGCTQVTEILYTPGVQLLAGLPPQFELATVYTAAVCTRAAASEAAAQLVGELASSQAAELRRTGGFDPL